MTGDVTGDVLVPAGLVLPESCAPAWSPWQLWVKGDGLHVHDVATGSLLVLSSGPPDGRWETVRRSDAEPWWLRRLAGRHLLDELRHRLAHDLSPSEVGAVAVHEDGWVIAVNDPLEEAPVRLLEGDHSGGAWERPLPRATARSVVGLVVLPDGDVVLADNSLHVVRRLRGTDTVWTVGRERQPGPGPGRLSSPSGCAFVDGHLLVPSEMSGDLAVLTLDGEVLEWRLGADSPARPERPTAVAAAGPGRAVVSDAHAGRLYALTAAPGGWQVEELLTDQTPSRTGPLAFPRALLLDEHGLVVADTGNGRLVAVDRLTGAVLSQVAVPGWPRAIAACGSALLVADGLSKRLLLLSRDSLAPHDLTGATSQVLALHTAGGDEVALHDPHHIAPAGGDDFWLVDSDLDDVLRFDLSGQVTVRWSTSPAGERFPLRDPHQVMPLPGAVLVVDTNNGRILRASDDLSECSVVVSGLARPRWVVQAGEGWLVSEHQGRVNAYGADWTPVAGFVVRPDAADVYLDMSDPPRCLLLSDGRLLMSDWQRGVVYDMPMPAWPRPGPQVTAG